MADDVMKEVDKLLKDREKYEAWLAKLESEKSASSERAYGEVLEDYRKRLDDVLTQLKAHSDSLRSKLGELEDRVATLEVERASRAEQLDESRLRRSVGEFEDDKEWKKLEDGLVGALQEKENELEGVRGEIGQLEEIVAQVEGAEAAPPPPPEPEPVAVAPEPEPKLKPKPKPDARAKPPPAPEPQVAAVEGGDDEGLITLEELVLDDEDMQEVEIAEPVAAEAERLVDQEAGEAGMGDELAFLESLSLGGGEGGKEAESFTFLEKGGSSGTPQTIICPHCSAANDPAEWYCTECGEELPAE
jgi:hypothetical protein